MWAKWTFSRGCRGPPAGRTEIGHSASSMAVTTHTTSSLGPEHQRELLGDSIKQPEAQEPPIPYQIHTS